MEMRFKHKSAVVGILLGSIGPFVMCPYYFFTKTPAALALACVFPWSIFLMEAETLSTLASAALFLLLSGLNLATFGAAGLFLGHIVETLKVR